MWQKPETVVHAKRRNIGKRIHNGCFFTGGHGHIGSWAAYFLVKEGEQIILYDTNPMVPDHLAEVAQNIIFIKGDVMDFPCLTEIFKKYSSFEVKVELGPGELMQRCEALNISQARTELGFEPKYSVEEGIKKYAGWMKEVMK